MNQTEAEFVKDLAKPVVEALEKVTERECPECKGEPIKGTFHFESKVCILCNGTGKVKWKWKPKVGEWYLTPDDEVRCIGDELDLESIPIVVDLNPAYIPILHWEEIERVLEGVGYYVDTRKLTPYGCGHKELSVSEIYLINSPDFISDGKGESRQEAVMQAVIKLGEEIHGTE